MTEQFPLDMTQEAIEAAMPVIERALAWSGRRKADRRAAFAIREALRAGGSVSLRIVVDSAAAAEPRGRVFLEVLCADGSPLSVGAGELFSTTETTP